MKEMTRKTRKMSKTEMMFRCGGCLNVFKACFDDIEDCPECSSWDLSIIYDTANGAEAYAKF